MPVILGVSASLRNARFGYGSELLCKEIAELQNKDQFLEYLKRQTKIRLDEFIESGRREKKPFDEIYDNLAKLKGDQGLSNSEAALAAGLWGAIQSGATISHCGLSSYFAASGKTRDLDALRERVVSADAILLAGPVYFGDRGSLAQSFIDFLQRDEPCREHIRGKPYAGIAVGAKRNGGQETTLIYQLIDMTNMNMLAVGNDSETTSQYGGTAVAGDVGTLADDAYGLVTSIGAGRRLAHIARVLEYARTGGSVKDKIKIGVWLLQDSLDNKGLNYLRQFCGQIEASNPDVEFRILDFMRERIYRCIACDICPVDVGHMDDYRCIVTAKNDLFVRHHREVVDADAILIAAYSPIDRSEILSVYQQFIERTRYLRRDDYVFADMPIAPFVISEVGANQNLHIRMLTSAIRHHTVLHHPIIGFEHHGKVLNWDAMIEQGLSFAETAKKLLIGRLGLPEEFYTKSAYNPVGYKISMAKTREDVASGRKDAFLDGRIENLKKKSRVAGGRH